MNEAKRKSLRDALGLIDKVILIVDDVCDKEQDAMDNLPDGLQCTDRFELMESAVDALTEAVDRMEEAKEQISVAL